MTAQPAICKQTDMKWVVNSGIILSLLCIAWVKYDCRHDDPAMEDEPTASFSCWLACAGRAPASDCFVFSLYLSTLFTSTQQNISLSYCLAPVHLSTQLTFWGHPSCTHSVQTLSFPPTRAGQRNLHAAFFLISRVFKWQSLPASCLNCIHANSNIDLRRAWVHSFRKSNHSATCSRTKHPQFVELARHTAKSLRTANTTRPCHRKQRPAL